MKINGEQDDLVTIHEWDASKKSSALGSKVDDAQFWDLGKGVIFETGEERLISKFIIEGKTIMAATPLGATPIERMDEDMQVLQKNGYTIRYYS